MAIIDITLELYEGLAVYEGDPPVRRWPYRRLPGDAYEASLLTLGAHAGTHVDAPRHFFGAGLSISELPLESLCGRARVLDLLSAGEVIDRAALAGHDFTGVERLLIRTVTGRGLREGRLNQLAHLTEDGARYLLDSTRLRLIGFDALSIEAAGETYPVHQLLLGSQPPVLILEGLCLEDVAPGDYDLCCLPLRWRDAEAAPARAVLRELTPR